MWSVDHTRRTQTGPQTALEQQTVAIRVALSRVDDCRGQTAPYITEFFASPSHTAGRLHPKPLFSRVAINSQ